MMVITNHQLFSHTYLAQLQADPSHDEAAAPIAQGLRDWMPYRDTSSLPSLLDSWVGPVLDFLDFYHASVDNAPHVRLLYARRGDEMPVGLCYVVPPGQHGSASSPRSLDNTSKGCHPMAQAVLALRERDLHWGMLTDGARWRLVDAQSLRRYEHYLEIDLDELARSDDLAPLRLFYAFFHRSAFTPSPSQGEGRGEGSLSQEKGRVGGGLDQLLAASARATKAAEDHLKARVSHNDGLMAQLCLGLVRADGCARYTEAERDVIYRDATYLLYRMLFILYAEARGLLPVDNPAYRAVSLTDLVQTAYTYKLRGMPDPQATTLWERLKRLCNAIYESDAALSIPAYNGGLFDDADKPYLRDGHIADAYLTEALFDLAYRSADRAGGGTPDGYQSIDYRDLSVRHLGSLYEGMIEYRLQIAEETLWARRDRKDNVRFLRTGEDGSPRKTDVEIEPGQVYFSQSPGERRATGTYYTPEYIVDYIVRQTVGRGLEERRAPLEEIQTSKVSQILQVSALQRTADEELLRFVEEQVLTFRVCDMGMGSDHFLVNSGHQMTNFIVETLHLTPWNNDRIDTNPAAWRRRVVEQCLYGVDLSLMAVELAKLSLWLASVAEGKPLSFLDHHLRQGNSLVGVRLEDLAAALAGAIPTKPSRRERKAREAGQLSMLEHPAFRQHVTAATDLLAQISARVVEKAEDVKAQAADYEQVRAELDPYRRLADLWTARHFGLDVDERQLRDISKYLTNGAVGPVPEYQRLLNEAQGLANECHFFHWELEFPQVLFDKSGQLLKDKAGFDAVVGNPPYDVLAEKELGYSVEAYKNYFKLSSVFTPAIGQKLNLYRFFVCMGVERTGWCGRFSFITPMAILGDLQAEPLRRWVLENFQIGQVEALPQKDDPYERVFFDAKLSTCVLVLQKRKPSILARLRVHPGRNIVEDSPGYEFNPAEILEFDPTNVSIPLLSQREWSLALRLSRDPRLVLCGEIARSNQGEINFTSDKRFLSSSPPGELVLRGSNIGRYELHREPKQGEPAYLDIDLFLAGAREGAKAHHHRHERVVYQRYAAIDNYRRLIATLIPASKFCGHTTSYFVASRYSLYAFLSLFNSRVPEWWFTLTSTNNNVNAYEVEAIPFPLLSFTTPNPERQRLGNEARDLYGAGISSGDFDTLLEFVMKRLPLKPSDYPGEQLASGQTDVIHDLLVYLAQQMIDLHKERQRLERETDLFHFVERDTPCLPLDKALGGPLGAGEMVGDLSAIRHDIEGLRLSQEEDGRWLLEVRAKLRDPESGWREHQRDRDGKFIRQWLPVYRMPLDEPTGRFYHYAFAHLRGFDGAGKFPGGYTRTTLEKLNATQVPKFVPVGLAPLAALEAELAEVRRKIRLTDGLIDQIVYRLYGLTEEEIAIVEGRLEHE